MHEPSLSSSGQTAGAAGGGGDDYRDLKKILHGPHGPYFLEYTFSMDRTIHIFWNTANIYLLIFEFNPSPKTNLNPKANPISLHGTQTQSLIPQALGVDPNKQSYPKPKPRT